MGQALSPIILLDAIREERKTRLAESSLAEFTKQAWHVIEPGTGYVHGWHVDAISEHLEAVTDGEIRNLLINMPPRHMKSILVSVMWPVWTWIERPEYRWLFSSYAGSLSIRDSLKCRRLISSEWFQKRWGHIFKLTGDQNAKTLFENDKYGYRFATSVGASTTGHGGDTIAVDDPHNALDAQSDAMRETALEWWDQSMSTRLNDPKKGSKVIVMQRLHEKDLSGHVLKQGGYEHLCLPAEFEGSTKITSIGWQDPRSRKGELLCPERFGPDEVADLKKRLGEYGAAGQLQQRPTPAGGGILKVKYIKKWRGDLPVIDYILQSYDTAYTADTENDPSACTVYGCFTDKEGKACVLLLDAWAEHYEYPELKPKVIGDWSASYGGGEGRRGKKPDAIIIEKKASGQSLIQDLRVSNIPVHAFDPGSRDKKQRAHIVAPLLESGCFYVLESTKRPGEAISWAQGLIDQMEKFPNDEHDDYVDTFTQALIFLRDAGYIDVDRFDGDEIEEVDYTKKRKVNPYAA